MRHAPIRWVSVLTRALLAASALAMPLATAQAHGHLVRSDPAKGSHVRTLPVLLSLTFNEPPNAPLSRVSLLGPGGQAIGLAPLALDPRDRATLVARINGTLAAGHYTVRWQMAGDDGHPVRGEYGFELDSVAFLPVSVPAPAAAVASDPPVGLEQAAAPKAASFDSESPLYALIRAVQFAAAILLIGSAAFRFAVLPRMSHAAVGSADTVEPMLARGATIAGSAAWTLLGVTLARFGAQHAAFFGVRTGWTGESVRALLSNSSWAIGWWLALTGSLLAIVAAWKARRSRSGGWTALALASLVIAGSLALSGHAAAATHRALALGIDVAHVIGAGGWVGGLTLVLAAGIPVAASLPDEQRHATIGALIHAFSPTALVFAGLLLVTGLLAGWRNLGSVQAIFGSLYGRMLVAKLAALSVAAGTGAYNWKRVLPALGTAPATARLRRSATAELVASLLIIVITGVLVATPMPTEQAM